MRLVIVNLGLCVNDSLSEKEKEILDLIEGEAVSEVSNEGSTVETYNMNFDLEENSMTDEIINQLCSIADYVETTGYIV